MRHLHFIFIVGASSAFLACASLSQHTTQIDSALTEIQAGRLEQGRVALEKLCTQGTTGACALIGKQVELKNPLSIMQSVTSEKESRFVIMVPAGESLNYFVRTPTSLLRLIPEHFARSGSRLAVDQVEAFSLDPKQSYELVVIGSDGIAWDRRSFRSLDTGRRRARIAVVSCMDDHYANEQAKIWPELAAQKPDVIFMIGDNVYADKAGAGPQGASASQLWDRYAETRGALAIFKTNPLIPVFAVWDDHDFGRNDGDRTYPGKTESTDIFYTFFAQRKNAPDYERGLGVGAKWSAFHVGFLFLDDRSFRSPDGLDLPDQTHFGLDQEKWLNENLASAKAPMFLISGDQFFGGYHHFESYEGNHPKSFARQLDEWKKIKVPLLFVSGDRHLSEILKVPSERLGYPTFELTSSAIHAHVFPDAFKRDPSPQQLAGVDGQYNYMIVELMRGDRNMLQLDVQDYGIGRKQFFQKNLMVRH